MQDIGARNLVRTLWSFMQGSECPGFHKGALGQACGARMSGVSQSDNKWRAWPKAGRVDVNLKIM